MYDEELDFPIEYESDILELQARNEIPIVDFAEYDEWAKLYETS